MVTFFLLIIYLAFISLGLPDSLLGVAWPAMQPEIGAAFESAGLLSMVVTGGTIVSSLVSGSLIERFGTGIVTFVSCLLTASALLGFSFAPSLFWLILLAIPLGLGAGAVDSGLNNYVANHYKAHHMSWLHCFWGVGATLGPIIMSYSMGTNDAWRDGYYTVSMLQFALVFILLLTLPLWKNVAGKHQPQGMEEIHTRNESTERDEATADKPGNPLQIKGVKFTLMAFLFYCGAEMTVGLWGASFLVGTRDLPLETAAVWVSMYYGGITVGRFITGFVTLKFNNLTLIRAGQMTAIAGAILLLLPLHPYLSLIGLVVIGLGLAPIFPCLLHETPARFGRAHSSRIMGYQMAVAYTGTTILPPLFGIVAAQISIGLFPVVILLFAVMMLLSSEKVNRILYKNGKSAV
ncbi:MFS transporter [Paenibacillus sp. p3-SID867]|uniref:MFS transporter n=1 Tax=Paenibacillus sp. p3-SID867 TaxID=2916363 RepID=UPI0021A296D7|nr:MFS transporter [Paenibacillus sp. p3-SID867]MCT1401025.1 MFS transporter [Paenibacillus sp. p3-SID867]